MAVQNPPSYFKKSAAGPQGTTLFKTIDITDGLEYQDIKRFTDNTICDKPVITKSNSKGKLLFKVSQVVAQGGDSPTRSKHRRERSNQSSTSSIKLLKYNNLSRLNTAKKGETRNADMRSLMSNSSISIYNVTDNNSKPTSSLHRKLVLSSERNSQKQAANSRSQSKLKALDSSMSS